MKRATLAIAVLLGAMGVSDQAIAASQRRLTQQTAVEGCQTALPSFEGALRKRPLGIINEGSSLAFISCGLSTEVLGSPGNLIVVVYLKNNGATNVNVSCTLVNSSGGLPVGATTLITKSAALPGATGIVWDFADNGGLPFKHASLSCAIPPGVGISGTQTLYDVDLGA